MLEAVAARIPEETAMIPLAAASPLALSPGELIIGILALICAALFLVALVAVGRSRRIDPIAKLGYLVVMLAFPLLGPLWALWTVRGKSRAADAARSDAARNDAAQNDAAGPRPRA